MINLYSNVPFWEQMYILPHSFFAASLQVGQLSNSIMAEVFYTVNFLLKFLIFLDKIVEYTMKSFGIVPFATSPLKLFFIYGPRGGFLPCGANCLALRSNNL